MAKQVRERTNELHDSQNRLLQLLDLDNSAILCFGAKNDVVYFNTGASDYFGYSNDEMYDLEFSDLFVEDMDGLMSGNNRDGRSIETSLQCISSDGSRFSGEAILNAINVMGETGCAVVLNSVSDGKAETDVNTMHDGEVEIPRDKGEVELSLKRIMEIASKNPGLLLGEELSVIPEARLLGSMSAKALLRDNAVNVMHSALACWEHDLGKSKLDLAEESKIWPVYIDKSTPTTRTMDKYLHIDSCPKNPRCQRVVDTAEFVLKKLGDHETMHQKKLITDLQVLRQSMSGF